MKVCMYVLFASEYARVSVYVHEYVYVHVCIRKCI